MSKSLIYSGFNTEPNYAEFKVVLMNNGNNVIICKDSFTKEEAEKHYSERPTETVERMLTNIFGTTDADKLNAVVVSEEGKHPKSYDDNGNPSGFYYALRRDSFFRFKDFDFRVYVLLKFEIF